MASPRCHSFGARSLGNDGDTAVHHPEPGAYAARLSAFGEPPRTRLQITTQRKAPKPGRQLEASVLADYA
jgi:hypothetical protein